MVCIQLRVVEIGKVDIKLSIGIVDGGDELGAIGCRQPDRPGRVSLLILDLGAIVNN